MADKQASINQTQFSFEEPIFENKAVYQDEIPPEEVSKKSKSKKKTLIIIGVLVFVAIIVFLVIAQSMTKKPVVQDDVIEDAVEVVKELSPFQKRIDDSRVQLELADPTKQDLSFPPIDMKIRLDPQE
jgi:hypothetical protein